MWNKLMTWLDHKERLPPDNHNENTKTWSKGYRKAFQETIEYTKCSKPQDMKIIIITLLIISLCVSLFLFLHSRDSPNISVQVNVDQIANAGDTDKVNINTASVQALESLPGIGSMLADRIILGRPYKDVWELDRVKGIGPKTIEGLKGRVVTK